MSKEILEKAKEYISLGLSVVPIAKSKTPCLTSWKPLEKEALTVEEINTLFTGEKIRKDYYSEKYNSYGIKIFTNERTGPPTGLAIICGAVSGNLEVVDVDVKNDREGGTLWEDYSSLIKDTDPELYNRLLIARTVNGGYHLIYRCETIEGNNPNLAKSNGTTAEVLIETRGEGGYIAVDPQPGYEFIQGSIHNIPFITPEERQMLFTAAMSLDQRPPQDSVENKSQETYTGKSSRLSPFDDYNDRGNVIELLKNHGWTELKTYGQRTYLLRPGEATTKAGQSGNLYTDAEGKRTLVVFSGSTKFEPGKAYSPSSVFILLECNGDTKKAYRELLAQGYGEPYIPEGEKKNSDQVKTEHIKVEVVNRVNQVNIIISEPGNILKTEEVKTALGEEVIITTPGPKAREETIKAIEALRGTGKRIYIAEPGRPEIRDYKYLLEAVFKKYGAIQEEKGHLSDRDIDSLVEEVVILGSSLEPIDRNIFTKEFISSGPIQELGITEEALRVAQDRLKVKEDQEAQARGLKDLLNTASGLYKKGSIKEALEELTTKTKELDLISGRGLSPEHKSFADLLGAIKNTPMAYRTGYKELDSFVGFTPGSVSFVAGRPSHGKTTFMFNSMMRMVDIYPEHNFYFFSYEEPIKNIIVKLLNLVIDTDFNGYFYELPQDTKHSNYEFIKYYIKEDRTDIPEIEYGKKKLGDLIDSQRLNIIDRNYAVEDLDTVLSYLNDKGSLGPVFIDYVQRMSTRRKTQDKRTEIAHISQSILNTAKRIENVPIILGAQLNREAVKEPKLDNLKEAGNLEEDGNTVLSVYCRAREEEEANNEAVTRNVELQIKALKNREGEPNRIATLTWDRWLQKIESR